MRPYFGLDLLKLNGQGEAGPDSVMKDFKVLIILLALIAMGVLLLMQNQAQLKLRQENEALKQQVQQAEQLTAENERLSNLVAKASTSASKEQMDELLKLRGEVGALRKQTGEINRLREENSKLLAAAQAKATQQQPSSEEDAVTAQVRSVAIAKMNDSKRVLLSFLTFAHDNREQLPANFEQAQAYLKSGAGQAGGTGLTGTNDFEVLYTGPLNAITNPASTILIRDRVPWQGPNGTWVRSYGFADGHSEVPKSVDGNYDDWERQHIVLTAPGTQ